MLSAQLLLVLAPQLWSRPVHAQSYGNVTLGQTVTYGNNTYVETWLAPTAAGTSWYWSQAITPAILGTVFVVINDHNQTQTITSTNSAAVASNTQYLKNGTLSLLTRTDVNELGTVTTTLPSAGDLEIVVAYPTPYFTVVDPISWQGLFPSMEYGQTCCNGLMTTASAVPQNHYSFPSLTGSTNTADRRGWLYAMATHDHVLFYGAQNISSLFAPATISSVRQHCPYQKCLHVSSAKGATGVRMAGALLETSTVHVTGTFSTSASPTASPKKIPETSRTASEGMSRLADPVSAETRTADTRVPLDSMSGKTLAAATVNAASKLLAETTHAVVTADPVSASDAKPTLALNSHLISFKGPLKGTQGADAVDEAGTLLANPVSAPGPGSAGPAAVHEITVSPDAAADGLLKTNTAAAIATVKSASKLLEENSQVAPSPILITLGTDFGLASVHLPGSTTELIASKDGATAVDAAIGLLTMDPDEVFRMTAGITTPAASKVADMLPESSPTSAQNIGDVIASLLGSQETKMAGSDPGPAPVLIGSSSLKLRPTELVSIVSGVSGKIPDIIASSQTIASSSSVLQPLPPTTPPPIVVGSSTITADSASQYVIAGQTLAPGSSITIGGTPIALQTDGPEGNVLVVGSSSSVLLQQVGPTAAAPPIVVGGSTITANPASQYVVPGQTLKPGSSITIGSGSAASIIALKTDGSTTMLVVGTSSSVLKQQPTAVITIGSAKITPAKKSQYIVGSQTLVPGAAAITVSGVKYSLASDGGEIVAGSSTQVLTTEDGAAGYIWSALGASSKESSSADSRDATTASGSKSGSASGTAEQPSATESQQASIAERVQPVCLSLLIASSLLFAYAV